MSTFTFQSHSLEDTQAFAKAMGESLRGREVIELLSDVGGGKTSFVKGLAHGLGIEETVQSPTFTISRIYSARDDLELHHFDFYRLSEPGVVADELAESLQEPNAVVAVEWGDIVQDVLPAHRISITFQPTGETTRVITVTTPDGLDYVDDAINKFLQARLTA